MKKFETFDFNIKKIKEQIEVRNGANDKLEFLIYVKKELKRVIRCFKSNRFVKWREPSDDCDEREEFIKNRYKYLSKIYGPTDNRTDDALERDIKVRKEELQDCLAYIEDEIDFIIHYKKKEKESYKQIEDDTQRKKIINYLLDNHPDFKDNHSININELAFELTDFLYPSIQKAKRKNKKESIRQELMQIKNKNIPFE